MTARLRLVPQDPAYLVALMESPERFEAVSGLLAAEDLRDFLVAPDVSETWLEGLRAAGAADPWLHGFAAVQEETDQVIGTGAFKGPPDENGVVEIAYGIVPSFEGQGYATELAAALVAFASADPRVHLLRAHTLPEPNASTHVLQKCGFAYRGEVIDTEDGLVWRWERGRS